MERSTEKVIYIPQHSLRHKLILFNSLRYCDNVAAYMFYIIWWWIYIPLATLALIIALIGIVVAIWFEYLHTTYILITWSSIILANLTVLGAMIPRLIASLQPRSFLARRVQVVNVEELI